MAARSTDWAYLFEPYARPSNEAVFDQLGVAGPRVPAIDAVCVDTFCDALREVIEPLQADGVGIRVASELVWITADVDSR